MQVEERLRFYEDGVAPTKNLTAMQDALRSIAEAAGPMQEDDANGGATEGQPKKTKVRIRQRSWGGFMRAFLSCSSPDDSPSAHEAAFVVLICPWLGRVAESRTNQAQFTADLLMTLLWWHRRRGRLRMSLRMRQRYLRSLRRKRRRQRMRTQLRWTQQQRQGRQRKRRRSKRQTLPDVAESSAISGLVFQSWMGSVLLVPPMCHYRLQGKTALL